MDMFKPQSEGLSKRAQMARRQEKAARELRQRLDSLRCQVGVRYGADATQDTNRKPSNAIWRDCPQQAIKNGEKDGVYFEDDFTGFPELQFVPTNTSVQTTSGGLGPYKVYCATAGTWIQDNMPHSTTAATAGGIISGLCDTDNDSMALGTSAGPFLFTTTQSGKIWFEARIATTSILTNMGQIFCGFCESINGVLGSQSAYSSTIPLGNADTANTTLSMLGFRRAEDGLSVLDVITADHSATEVLQVTAASTGVLAANTWIKLGIKIDFSQTAYFATFYINGVDCGTYMTKATMLALTFADVSNMGLCLAFYADSAGTADYLYMDWWKAYQCFEAC